MNHFSATDSVCSKRHFKAWKLDGQSASRNCVSSAYIMIFPYEMCCGRSLVNSKNRTGPRMDPWTTPCVTFSA